MNIKKELIKELKQLKKLERKIKYDRNVSDTEYYNVKLEIEKIESILTVLKD